MESLLMAGRDIVLASCRELVTRLYPVGLMSKRIPKRLRDLPVDEVRAMYDQEVDALVVQFKDARDVAAMSGMVSRAPVVIQTLLAERITKAEQDLSSLPETPRLLWPSDAAESG